MLGDYRGLSELPCRERDSIIRRLYHQYRLKEVQGSDGVNSWIIEREQSTQEEDF